MWVGVCRIPGGKKQEALWLQSRQEKGVGNKSPLLPFSLFQLFPRSLAMLLTPKWLPAPTESKRPRKTAPLSVACFILMVLWRRLQIPSPSNASPALLLPHSSFGLECLFLPFLSPRNFNSSPSLPSFSELRRTSCIFFQTHIKVVATKSKYKCIWLCIIHNNLTYHLCCVHYNLKNRLIQCALLNCHLWTCLISPTKHSAPDSE